MIDYNKNSVRGAETTMYNGKTQHGWKQYITGISGCEVKSSNTKYLQFKNLSLNAMSGKLVRYSHLLCCTIQIVMYDTINILQGY